MTALWFAIPLAYLAGVLFVARLCALNDRPPPPAATCRECECRSGVDVRLVPHTCPVPGTWVAESRARGGAG